MRHALLRGQLDKRTEISQFGALRLGQMRPRRGFSGVGHDDASAPRELPCDRVILVGSDVAGGEDGVVPGDHLDNLPNDGQQLALIVGGAIPVPGYPRRGPRPLR